MPIIFKNIINLALSVSDFPEIIAAVNDGSSVAEACECVSIPIMTEISFERYKLKHTLGKSGLGKASFKYKNQAVISEIST